MSAAAINNSLTLGSPREALAPQQLPILWRDPHTLPAAELVTAIERLEQACVQNPGSPELRVCLGMAYAMHLDVYKSMDSLEAAVELAPEMFIAQFKKAELLYRLRALPRAETETLKSLDLATTNYEVGLARKQLQEIRTLIRNGTQKPEWNKPLAAPALVLLAMVTLTFLVNLWK